MHTVDGNEFPNPLQKLLSMPLRVFDAVWVVGWLLLSTVALRNLGLEQWFEDLGLIGAVAKYFWFLVLMVVAFGPLFFRLRRIRSKSPKPEPDENEPGEPKGPESV